MARINWGSLKQKLREDVVALPHFLKNPVQGMRTLPHWDWSTLLILQAGFAIACSILGNLIERDYVGVVVGILVAPLTNALMVAIGAGIFYYVFKYLFHNHVAFRRLYTHVLFASIPMVILSTVAFLVPPLILLGCASTLLLLYVGFVEEFQVPRVSIRNILIGTMVVYALYWGFQQVQNTSHHKTMRQKATPESLDILEKELNHDE